MKARQDYFHELIKDARAATPDAEMQAALVIADGLNGVRKALMEMRPETGNQFPRERNREEWV